MNVTRDNNRNDSPSRANLYQGKVIQALVASFSSTLFALLHSPEAMEAMTSSIPGSPTKQHQNVVGMIALLAFEDTKDKAEFYPHELKHFDKLRDQIFQRWERLMENERP